MTTNTDIRELLSLPARELDARLATALEGKPARVHDWMMCKYWRCHHSGGPDVDFVPLRFSDPLAARKLLDSVEAEIERRGLHVEYTNAILRLGSGDGQLWKLLRISAQVRAAAATWVLEQAMERVGK